MRTCKILHWLVRLWVYSFIPHRDLYKSFHYYSPQKPSGKPEGFCGFQTFPRELCPLGKVGDCGNLPRPWGTINSREEFFHRQSRQKNIFHFVSPSAEGEILRSHFNTSKSFAVATAKENQISFPARHVRAGKHFSACKPLCRKRHACLFRQAAENPEPNGSGFSCW